jgi:hypothetical protein
MSEFKRFLGDGETVHNRRTPLKSSRFDCGILPAVSEEKAIESIDSESVIEELVRTGRSPFCIGLIGENEEGLIPFYQVPPKGHNPELVVNSYRIPDGPFVFVYQDGTEGIGSTYALNNEQAKIVEDRITALRK